MICTKKEFIRTGADGTKWWQVVLTADTDPDTLNLTGADVENLNDALGLAAGSLLITPTANYIAFEDGVFQAKGGEAPAEIEGIKSFNVTTLENVTPAFSTMYPASASATYDVTTDTDFLNTELTVTLTPSSNWYAYDPGAGTVGGKGETITYSFTADSDPMTFSVSVQDNDDPDNPDNVIDVAINLSYSEQH